MIHINWFVNNLNNNHLFLDNFHLISSFIISFHNITQTKGYLEVVFILSHLIFFPSNNTYHLNSYYPLIILDVTLDY